jgi:hypothetical protein
VKVALVRFIGTRPEQVQKTPQASSQTDFKNAFS